MRRSLCAGVTAALDSYLRPTRTHEGPYGTITWIDLEI
jgi:hypothetical protein